MMQQPMMVFRRLHDAGGGVRGIELESDWLPVADFSPEILECADPCFFRHGDGLIAIRTMSEVATYGIVGEGERIGVQPTLRARLLNVLPSGRWRGR